MFGWRILGSCITLFFLEATSTPLQTQPLQTTTTPLHSTLLPTTTTPLHSTLLPTTPNHNHSTPLKFFQCNQEVCMHSDGIERSLLEAVSQCSSTGMYLLELPDPSTSRLFDDFAVQHFPSKYIHLNLRMEMSKWLWISDHELDKKSFTLKLQNGEVAGLHFEGGGDMILCAEDMDKLLPWICSRNDGKCEKSSFEGVCYFVRGELNPGTFHEALTDCSLVGAQLASFHNLDVSRLAKYLGSLLTANSSYWVGLQKQSWRWLHSRSLATYNRWHYGRTYGKNPCADVKYSLEKASNIWGQNYCHERIMSICVEKIPKDETLNIEELNVVLILGWVLAGVFLVTSVALLIALLLSKRKSNPIKTINSGRNSVYPQDIGQNQISRPSVSASSKQEVYVEGTNYYEEPNANKEEEPKYTELVN